MTLRERALAWLRVPHEPSPPAGDEELRVFRAAPNYMRYLYAKWLAQHIFAAFGLLLALRFTGTWGGQIPERAALLRTILYAVESLAVVGFVFEAVASFLLVRLDFEQRWYIVSDRSLRVREGLVRLHEKTMTFANVQNVSVQQGPLERMLGIANVEVRSAGGGSTDGEPGKHGEDLHVAYFRGVSDAESIREAIRERLRHFRDSGLGDPDDVQPAAPAQSPLLHHARELALEARLLREALNG
ncbi:MAG TPA: PH domain-containing protein [Longimicrobiales bacterium]|nr:PH domain-containing protein [Longimicrobiales bacterium]